MDILGIEFRADILLGWFNSAVSYIAIRWQPSLAIVLLALVLYWAGGWISRLVQRRFAAKTETTIDDELVRFIRKALRLTVVAWALWQLMGMWVPLLGEQTRDGEWVPYETQPREWVWGIWIALVFIPLSRFVRHLMRGFESKLLARSSTTGLDETALPMINRFIRTGVIVIGVLFAMPHLGIEIAPLLAGAGVVGLALSLAAKDTLSNLMAGVLLIMDRPFQVGDRIELWSAPRETGTWGDVLEIGLRATKIRNPDNLVIVVPNNEIMRRDIINYTMSGESIRLRIPFSVAYESDIQLAKTLLLQVAQEVEGVKPDPKPIVIVRGFGPSEVNLQLRVWISEARARRRISDQISESAMGKFQAAGVEIPYPKRELYVSAKDSSASNVGALGEGD